MNHVAGWVFYLFVININIQHMHHAAGWVLYLFIIIIVIPDLKSGCWPYY
jgi:hypothetical protein